MYFTLDAVFAIGALLVQLSELAIGEHEDIPDPSSLGFDPSFADPVEQERTRSYVNKVIAQVRSLEQKSGYFMDRSSRMAHYWDSDA